MIQLNRFNEPYKSITAAKSACTIYEKRHGVTPTPVEVEGGFGIEIKDASEVVPERPRRTRVGRRNVLKAPDKKGYKRRFVNIDPKKNGWDDVLGFIESGYRPVEGNVEIGDSRVAAISKMGSANIASVGGGAKAILMEIKEEWYEEDQAEKQAEVDEKENLMRVDEKSAPEGFYGKVHIGTPPG